jgi:hypothetical protein
MKDRLNHKIYEYTIFSKQGGSNQCTEFRKCLEFIGNNLKYNAVATVYFPSNVILEI